MKKYEPVHDVGKQREEEEGVQKEEEDGEIDWGWNQLLLQKEEERKREDEEPRQSQQKKKARDYWSQAKRETKMKMRKEQP